MPDPFVKTLKQSRSRKRKIAVLRLLRGRGEHVPELAKISQRLARSKDQEIRGFAKEILIRSRVSIVQPTPTDAKGIRVDDKTGVTFVEIHAGEFQMGSEKGQQREKPVHTVQISHGFWLGKYPVTNEQYARFLEAAGRSEKPEYWGDRRLNQPEQPVVGVSWHDAQAYCEWAGCRLPTEAEWEYACRAGTVTEYYFADDPQQLGEYAWFNTNSSGQTQPVGAKKPNAWGLHDMHGNVWEWCHDWFEEKYYAQSVETDPSGPSEGSDRVYRGGSWSSSAEGCRSAYRYRDLPVLRYDCLGFRVARSPSGK